jgi:anti-sigma factor RsiW
MMSQHVLDQLAAYDDGQLEPSEAARVDAHLAACAPCAAALADARHARGLLEALPPAAMPVEDVARLRARLRHPVPRRPHRAWPLGLAAAVIIGVSAALIAARIVWPALQLVAATTPTGLENEARALHDVLQRDQRRLEIRTTDAVAIRRWLSEHGGPDASRIKAISQDGWPEIRMRGASVVPVGSARVSLVAYDVDGQPATLLTAEQSDIASAPASAWFAKRVHVHPDADGRPALSWTTSGQTYAIVTERPETGLRACLVCHSDPSFRQRIDDAMLRLRVAPSSR